MVDDTKQMKEESLAIPNHVEHNPYIVPIESINIRIPKDDVNRPEHYTAGGIEVIDIQKAKLSREMFLGFLKGNLLKYILRAGKKGEELEDLHKGRWYLNRYIKELEEGDTDDN